MKCFNYLPLFLLCLVVSNGYSQVEEKSISTTFHSISSHDLLNDAAELSSPKYGGRLSGSPGYQAAAEWVAGQLKQAGVKPGLSDGTYLQYFPNAYTDVLSPGSVTLLAGKNNQKKNTNFRMIISRVPTRLQEQFQANWCMSGLAFRLRNWGMMITKASMSREKSC